MPLARQDDGAAMSQNFDQLLAWATAEMPSLKLRLAATHAAISHARMQLRAAEDVAARLRGAGAG